MKRANYQIVEDLTGRPLVIKDLGPWDQHPTITNDAEGVVAELHLRGVLPADRRLLYYDSEGQLDEILLDVAGCFAGFAPGPRAAVADEKAATEYCISSDEEHFSGQFPDREGALREAIYGNGLEIGQRFFLGQAVARKASDYFDINGFLEHMSECAYEDVGEAAEAWPDLSGEEIAELEKLIRTLLEERVPVSFFAVEQVEKIEVTPELFAKYSQEQEAKG